MGYAGVSLGLHNRGFFVVLFMVECRGMRIVSGTERPSTYIHIYIYTCVYFIYIYIYINGGNGSEMRATTLLG